MSQDDTSRTRRERSARYPGVPLAESLEFSKVIADRGLDSLPAGEIALAMGYKNAKTNTFSARLSAARQFGLLVLEGDGYTLTPLARAILHPVDPDGLPALYRQAFAEPPLYVDLSARLAGKKVPEASILANVLYHNHQIIASAKLSAAEAFLESARFAEVLGLDGVVRPLGQDSTTTLTPAKAPASTATLPPVQAEPHAPQPRTKGNDARLDLRLWGPDKGKTIRLRAPESMTRASFERFLQAVQLLVRIEDPDQADGGLS
ncbi:MAG: hypothetical protein ABI353_13470 [Isosphaeraceae bacterium]